MMIAAALCADALSVGSGGCGETGNGGAESVLASKVAALCASGRRRRLLSPLYATLHLGSINNILEYGELVKRTPCACSHLLGMIILDHYFLAPHPLPSYIAAIHHDFAARPLAHMRGPMGNTVDFTRQCQQPKISGTGQIQL
jgi:hypothetical protein